MPFSYEINPDEASRRRRRSSRDDSSNERIEYKALGANIGSLARGTAVFDPNAYDGDGDGLVQDSTPFERPAVLSNIASIAREGLASESATGIFSNGMSDLAGLSNSEIAKRVVPDNPTSLLERRLQYSHTGKVTTPSELDNVSFHPDYVARAREMVERALDERPALRASLDRFGCPPIAVTTRDNSYSGMFISDAILINGQILFEQDGDDWLISGGKRKAPTFPEINDVELVIVATDNRHIFTHEWGHYFHFLALHQHPEKAVRDVATMMYSSYWSDTKRERRTTGEKLGLGKFWDYYHEVYDEWYTGKDKPGDDIPFVGTLYGSFSPVEFFAEAINSYFSPDEKKSKLLNPAGRDLVETFLGLRSGGLASTNGRKTSTGSSLEGMSPTQIAEVIVPRNIDEALALLDDHQQLLALNDDAKRVNIDGLKHAFVGGADAFDFSPEAQSLLRGIIVEALTKNPLFKDVVQRHGFPPVMITKRGTDWNGDTETTAISMIEGFPAIIMNAETINEMLSGKRTNVIYEDAGWLDGTTKFVVSQRMDALLAHEWAHYLNRSALANHPDPQIRALAGFWWSDTWDIDPELNGLSKVLVAIGLTPEDRFSQRVIGARKFREKVKNNKAEKWNGYPHVMSQYGQTMPAEAFAEGTTAILIDDINLRDMVSPQMREDIISIMGEPRRYRRDIARGVDEGRAGLASLSINRDATGDRELVLSPNSPSPGSSPMSGRDWLRDADNDEIAEALTPVSVEDALNLILMNMGYGQDMGYFNPSEMMVIKGMIEQTLFGSSRSADLVPVDFTPQGVDRTRNIILKALNASPEFAWAMRTFGSPPIFSFDPVTIEAIRQQEIANGAPELLDSLRGDSVMGWSLGVYGIFINTASWAGKKNFDIGQRRRTTNPYPTRSGEIREFIGNVDMSMPGTLYHEWFHGFWNRVLGWHSGFPLTSFGGSTQGLAVPGERQARLDYLFPNDPFAAERSKTVKETFDPFGFIPFSAQMPYTPQMLDKSIRKILREGGSQADVNDFKDLIDAYAFSMSRGWTPEHSQMLLEVIEQRFPFLVEDMAPLIRGAYATASRQEQFAEMGTLFVTPDKRERSAYLTPEMESLIAFVLGLKDDKSAGDYEKPWEKRVGPSSSVALSESIKEKIGDRISTSQDIFVTPSALQPNSDVVSIEAGMITMSTGGYKFSVDGDIAETSSAYEAWSDWQENWRMRYISSEMLGIQPPSTTDISRWQSVTNKHLIDRDVNESSPVVKDEVSKSAMMTLSLMRDISDGGQVSSEDMYHGIKNIPEGSELLNAEIGESFVIPLTSFSPDLRETIDSLNADAPGVLRDLESTPKRRLVLKMKPGASVSNSTILGTAEDKDGNEYSRPIEAITAGEFRIVSKTTENGVDVVEIEQTGVLDPVLGEKRVVGDRQSEERAGLASKMRDSSAALERKINIAKSSTGVSDKRSAIDDVNQEAKRHETIGRLMLARGDEIDRLDGPSYVGGLASLSPLKTRADKHGVSLDAFDDEKFDEDDVEWSSNDWSFSKTGKVMAGDVVVVRTRKDGKKELLTIERKSGPFRGAVALPGGLQDGDEDLYDTAEREMLEEVSVSPQDARNRRILGQIDVKDWDPRFVEGGRIAGIRFDLDEDQSSVVKAGDDAEKFNWIDIEELSTGKYPIAFGHASWLAEAFADDPVLGPRFAVLAEASRVRNQRLIKKIDAKRREAGVKEFGEMPDPSQPYKTTTEGIRTGLASQNLFVRNINVPIDVATLSDKILSENLNYLTRNPVKDEHYNQEINGVNAKQILDNIKQGKITHKDAVALYLAIKEINRRDEITMFARDKTAEQRILLNKLRQIISGKQDHKIVQFRRDMGSSWAVYRGSDYLGDYDTEEEANEVLQFSLSERSGGLASVSVPMSRRDSTLSEIAKESINKKIDAKQIEIDELKELNKRLSSALEELEKEKVWSGEKYNIRVEEGESLSPTSYTREELEEYAKELGISLDKYIENLSSTIKSVRFGREEQIKQKEEELIKLKDRLSYLETKEQNDRSFHIDELLADEQLANELRKRHKAVIEMPAQDRSVRFRDEETGEIYVIHWGASSLAGGVLDPKRSRGNDDGKLGAGDTRSLNRMSAKKFAGDVATDRDRIELAKGLMERILNGEVLEPAKLSKLEMRALGYYGFRVDDYPRFPENNNFIPDLVERVKSRIKEVIIPQIQEEKIKNNEQQLLVEQLEKDDWQFSSTYPAAALAALFGSYGGRYADEGADISTASSGDRTPQSPVTGIHVFRVKYGRDAHTFGGDGEIHLIGEHTPVASLVADNYNGSANPAVDTWAGWVDMVIEQDKEHSRRGLASRRERAEDFSEQEIERMRERQKELEDMSYQELLPIFSDGEYIYVVHAGSEEIEGNTLTPSRSIGDESRNMSGNTRAINKSMSDRYIKQYEQDRSSRTSLDYIINALRNGEMIENPKAFRKQNEGEQGAIQGLSGILFDVGTKDGPYLGTFSRSIRDNKPFPQQEDLDKIGITREELADYLEEVGVPIFDERIKSRESVVQKLREDEGQFTSSYPLAAVVKRVPIEGYGGRYGEDYDPSEGGGKDRSFDIGIRFDRQGVHIVRARIGKNAAQMSVAPRLYDLESLDRVDSQDLEIHLVGEHEVIASLSTPTWAKSYMDGDESWRLGRDFFKAWAEEIVKTDKQSRAGLASRVARTPEMDERDQRVVDAYVDTTMTLQEIADQEGETLSNVRAILRRARGLGKITGKRVLGQREDEKQAVDRNFKIMDMYTNTDMTYEEIAKEMGMSRDSVSQVIYGLRKNGILTEKRGSSKKRKKYAPRVSETTKQNVIDAYNNSAFTLREIADQEGIPVATVTNILKTARQNGKLTTPKRKTGVPIGSKRGVIKGNESRGGLASSSRPLIPMRPMIQPSIQLEPTNDIEEAKRTGRPLSILRPGTMPPRTQAEYDKIVNSRAEKMKEALAFREENKDLLDEADRRARLNIPLTDEIREANRRFYELANEVIGQDERNTYDELKFAMNREFFDAGISQYDVDIIIEGIIQHLRDRRTYDYQILARPEIWNAEGRLKHSEDALDKADIAIAFPIELLDKLIEDGRFKTQFETRSSRGSLHPVGRMQTDVAHFGYHPSTAPEMRPVYGYLTKGGTIDGNRFGDIKQYGELQFIMKRDINERSTYTTHDSLSTGLIPSPMGVPSVDASAEPGATMYAEAQIHGGVNLSDVDYVTVNVGEQNDFDWRNNKISEADFESISERLARVGIRVVPVRDGEIIDTWNGGNVMKEDLGPVSPWVPFRPEGDAGDFVNLPGPEPKKVVA